MPLCLSPHVQLKALRHYGDKTTSSEVRTKQQLDVKWLECMTDTTVVTIFTQKANFMPFTAFCGGDYVSTHRQSKNLKGGSNRQMNTIQRYKITENRRVLSRKSFSLGQPRPSSRGTRNIGPKDETECADAT
jgi:hypothetical protein